MQQIQLVLACLVVGKNHQNIYSAKRCFFMVIYGRIHLKRKTHTQKKLWGVFLHHPLGSNSHPLEGAALLWGNSPTHSILWNWQRQTRAPFHKCAHLSQPCGGGSSGQKLCMRWHAQQPYTCMNFNLTPITFLWAWNRLKLNSEPSVLHHPLQLLTSHCFCQTISSHRLGGNPRAQCGPPLRQSISVGRVSNWFTGYPPQVLSQRGKINCKTLVTHLGNSRIHQMVAEASAICAPHYCSAIHRSNQVLLAAVTLGQILHDVEKLAKMFWLFAPQLHTQCLSLKRTATHTLDHRWSPLQHVYDFISSLDEVFPHERQNAPWLRAVSHWLSIVVDVIARSMACIIDAQDHGVVKVHDSTGIEDATLLGLQGKMQKTICWDQIFDSSSLLNCLKLVDLKRKVRPANTAIPAEAAHNWSQLAHFGWRCIQSSHLPSFGIDVDCLDTIQHTGTIDGYPCRVLLDDSSTELELMAGGQTEVVVLLHLLHDVIHLFDATPKQIIHVSAQHSGHCSISSRKVVGRRLIRYLFKSTRYQDIMKAFPKSTRCVLGAIDALLTNQKATLRGQVCHRLEVEVPMTSWCQSPEEMPLKCLLL